MTGQSPKSLPYLVAHHNVAHLIACFSFLFDLPRSTETALSYSNTTLRLWLFGCRNKVEEIWTLLLVWGGLVELKVFRVQPTVRVNEFGERVSLAG